MRVTSLSLDELLRSKPRFERFLSLRAVVAAVVVLSEILSWMILG